MQSHDHVTRRWQILVCSGGTVHIHYGTGSLHIMREDFLGLAEDLRRIASSLEVGEALEQDHSHRDHIH